MLIASPMLCFCLFLSNNRRKKEYIIASIGGNLLKINCLINGRNQARMAHMAKQNPRNAKGPPGACGRGSATNVSSLLTSARSSVTEKKKRSETLALIRGGRAPLFVRCN
jgi:hypothetical protein